MNFRLFLLYLSILLGLSYARHPRVLRLRDVRPPPPESTGIAAPRPIPLKPSKPEAIDFIEIMFSPGGLISKLFNGVSTPPPAHLTAQTAVPANDPEASAKSLQSFVQNVFTFLRRRKYGNVPQHDMPSLGGLCDRRTCSSLYNAIEDFRRSDFFVNFNTFLSLIQDEDGLEFLSSVISNPQLVQEFTGGGAGTPPLPSPVQPQLPAKKPDSNRPEFAFAIDDTPDDYYYGGGGTVPSAGTQVRVPDSRVPQSGVPNSRVPDSRVPDSRVPAPSPPDDYYYGGTGVVPSAGTDVRVPTDNVKPIGVNHRVRPSQNTTTRTVSSAGSLQGNTREWVPNETGTGTPTTGRRGRISSGFRTVFKPDTSLRSITIPRGTRTFSKPRTNDAISVNKPDVSISSAMTPSEASGFGPAAHVRPSASVNPVPRATPPPDYYYYGGPSQPESIQPSAGGSISDSRGSGLPAGPQITLHQFGNTGTNPLSPTSHVNPSTGHSNGNSRVSPLTSSRGDPRIMPRIDLRPQTRTSLVDRVIGLPQNADFGLPGRSQPEVGPTTPAYEDPYYAFYYQYDNA